MALRTNQQRINVKSSLAMSMVLMGAVLFEGTSAAAASAPGNVSVTQVRQAKTPPRENPWIASFLSYADFKQVSEKSLHYSEVSLGYTFSPYFYFSGLEYFTGKLSPQNDEKPDFGDPEFGPDFTLPLANGGSLGEVSLLAGTSVILPASRWARNTDMTAAWGLNGGVKRKGSTWTVRQINWIYFFNYRDERELAHSPEAAIDDYELIFGGESEKDSGAGMASAPDRTYTSSENRLELVGSLTEKLLWKSDIAYLTDVSGESEKFSESLRFVSRLNYGWTPNFRTFGGVVSQSPIGNPPGLFSDRSWAIRVGIYISI